MPTLAVRSFGRHRDIHRLDNAWGCEVLGRTKKTKSRPDEEVAFVELKNRFNNRSD